MTDILIDLAEKLIIITFTYFIAIRPSVHYITDKKHEREARRIAIEQDQLIRDTKYDEKEIIGHLDYIILEVLDAYELLHIQPKNIYYINGKLEQKIIDHVSEEVTKKLSKTLMAQLAMIYDSDSISDFLGMHIYLTTLDYVLTHNLENSEEGPEGTNNNVKLPVTTNTDIGDAL